MIEALIALLVLGVCVGIIALTTKSNCNNDCNQGRNCDCDH